RDGALAHLEQNLFRYPTRAFGGPPPAEISLCCAADPRREAECVAKAIMRLAEEENLSWERIAVATRDMETYSPLLEQEFTRRGIPFFTDHKRGMTGHPLASLTLALLELARAPWQEEALFAAVKTGFFPIKDEEADLLENHCLAQGVEPWRWAAASWPGLPPALLPAAQEIQALLDPFLARVSDAGRGEGQYGVTELSGALYDCLERLRVPQTLAAWMKSLSSNDIYAQLHAQVWQESVRLLDELAGILGGATAPLTEYAATLRAGLAAVSIGVVPPRRHEVQIGSLERSRLPRVEALFLLGASEGALPPRQADDSFIDGRDRLALYEAGLSFMPGTRDSYFEEMFFIYNVLSKSGSRIYITRPLGDGAGGEKMPSFLLSRMKQLFPGLRESFAGREKSPATARGWNIPEVSRLDAATRHTLHGEWMQVSVTELERYAACPFGYFAQNCLKLKERPKAEAGSPEAGQLYHHALCDFGRELTETAVRGRSVDADWCAAKMDALFRQVVAHPRYQAFRRDSRSLRRAERIRQILVYVAGLLGEHVRNGAFLPWAFEKDFGSDAAWPPIVAEKAGEPADGRFGVGGRIDRIDLARSGSDNYLRVIDYKSSPTDFSLERFYHGLSLQLPLYLEAARRFALDGNVKPAGFLYFPVREPEISASCPLTPEEAGRRKKQDAPARGLLLDKSVRPYETEFHTSPMVSAKRMEALRRHLQRLLLSGGERLLAGDVRIRPYKLRDSTACQWCRFGGVCHFDAGLPEYDYNRLKEMAPADIWTQWETRSEDD
ncbi:MAG: exodeoxyribonuclease V subunit gamma, partial [Gracilibacteraceae bacterium]|nr:exodeoxyribonuclease V subunit gamma [Gracilibacteraceae bacterium]